MFDAMRRHQGRHAHRGHPNHRSESRLGMHRPQISSGRHAAGAAVLDAPTEVIPVVTSEPTTERSSRLERVLERLPVSGGVVAAVVGLGLVQALGGVMSDASSSTSAPSSSSTTLNSYLGTSPLGCDVYDASAGSASRVTMTDPYCTQQALAQRMCNVSIGDDPRSGTPLPTRGRCGAARPRTASSTAWAPAARGRSCAPTTPPARPGPSQ